MNDNHIHFEVHRTVVGTIVEIICAMFMLVVWVITIVATTRHDMPQTAELYVNAVIEKHIDLDYIIADYFALFADSVFEKLQFSHPR